MKLSEALEKIKTFTDTYLVPLKVMADGKTRQPLEHISLTIFVCSNGVVQYHTQRMFLVPDYTDSAVGHIIRIFPWDIFGYYHVKKPMSVLDIHLILEEMGLKPELVKTSAFA